jgi:hypothetical protein
MATKDITDLQCIEAAIEFHRQPIPREDPLEALSRTTGQPYKVCLRAYERAMRRGYLDCGVSVRTAWATERGKRYLFLAEFDALLGEGYALTTFKEKIP